MQEGCMHGPYTGKPCEECLKETQAMEESSLKLRTRAQELQRQLDDIVCRGSIALNSGCGTCSKCKLELAVQAQTLKHLEICSNQVGPVEDCPVCVSDEELQSPTFTQPKKCYVCGAPAKQTGLKDHQIQELVNELRDSIQAVTKVQCTREIIHRVVVSYLERYDLRIDKH